MLSQLISQNKTKILTNWKIKYTNALLSQLNSKKTSYEEVNFFF